MFGLLQPCRRRLGPDLYRAWTAHLCGTCLAAGKDFGQVARAATNVDGLLVSVLVAAQQTGGVDRQMAGRCPLRRLRRAEVVAPDAAAARYAAAVSLLLAGTKLADHVADGDLPRSVRPVRPVVRRVAAGWTTAGTASAAAAGLDPSAATALLERQSRVEAAAGPGDLLAVTAPTEEITAEVLATTATIADRPANREPLALVGRMFGRVAHLLDAVGDLESDRRRGAWNPLTATATDLPAARALVERAVDRLQGALDRVEFTDPELARHLLGRGLSRTGWPASSPQPVPVRGPGNGGSRSSPVSHGPRRRSAGTTTATAATAVTAVTAAVVIAASVIAAGATADPLLIGSAWP